jgi:hypothetical protein
MGVTPTALIATTTGWAASTNARKAEGPMTPMALKLPRMSGLTMLCAVVAALAAWPASAGAELRTGSHSNPYVNHPDERQGTPSNPVVESARIRFDRTAGSIEAAIRFSTPIADPAETSALRPYWYEVTVGDFMGGICFGGERSWLRISGRLGDPGKAELTRWLDFLDEHPFHVPATESVSPDRREVLVAVTHPSLAGVNLICGEAELNKDDDPRSRFTSSTFEFLFDGFSRLDGALNREAEHALRDQIEFFDRDLADPRRARSRLKLDIDCRRTFFRERVRCTATGRFRQTPGRPRIHLRGRMTFPVPYRERDLETGWRYSLQGALVWRRCPEVVNPPAHLIGRRCRLPLRWRGRRDLTSAVGS